jgi:dolichol-phosphate mannosyltransferase
MYSFVIPVKDEAQVIPLLHERLELLLSRLDQPAEVLFIDDGSKDRSGSMMKGIVANDPKYKLIQFSRNFGHQIAISAGLDHTDGDAVIVMDADLQDPPDIVLEMIKAWKEGAEVVHAVRIQRNGESFLKKLTAAVFYRFLKYIVNHDLPLDTGDFRLVDRRVVQVFRSMKEQNRYVRGMFSWIGFKQVSVFYQRQPRAAGKTKFSWRKMTRFALDGIFALSEVPARFILSAAVVSMLLGPVVSYFSIIPGLIVFFGGLQLFAIGIIGQYIIRSSAEIRGRPLYIVASKHGFD